MSVDSSAIPPWQDRFSQSELDLLARVQCGMPLAADMSRADVTLLVAWDGQALVIAQSHPASIATLYRQSWVGNLQPLSDNSVLAAGLDGRAGRQQLDLTDMGTPIVQQALPVMSEQGRPIAVLQIETNLIASERHKRRHKRFRQAVRWLQQMVLRGDLRSPNAISRFGEWDGVLFVDESYRIRYLSGIANNLYRRLGYLDDLQGRHIGDLQTKDEVLIRQAFGSMACQEHQVQEGSRFWTRTVVPVWSYPLRWWPPGGGRQPAPTLRGALVMVRDNTEVLEKARQLEVLSAMIKEVHHRVKNNLQTVASILRMQARRSESEDTRLQLGEAVNRVLAVAVIHDFLSRDDDQAINLREVCQRIILQTRRAALEPGQQIDLRVEGASIYLSSQQATVAALVINELLLNALQHGFQGRDQGTVRIELAADGDQVIIQVEDDGVGLALDEELPSDSLGLSIVRTLVDDSLKGQFVLEPAQPGVRATIRFERVAGD